MALPLGAILGLLGGGGALGGMMAGGKGGMSKFMFGDPAKTQQFQRFTPEQQSIMDQLMQQGAENMDFSGVEGLAKKRFEEDTIPSIAERFTSMGSGGAQRSSAFESSLGRAGSDLEAQLAALKPQFGAQQLQMGLQPRFDTGFSSATSGFGQQMGESLMQLLPLLMQLSGGK